MYGLPGQTVTSWRNELDRVLSVGTGHLSLYELTLKDNTKLAKLVRLDRVNQSKPTPICLYSHAHASTQNSRASPPS